MECMYFQRIENQLYSLQLFPMELCQLITDFVVTIQGQIVTSLYQKGIIDVTIFQNFILILAADSLYSKTPVVIIYNDSGEKKQEFGKEYLMTSTSINASEKGIY